MAVRYEVLVAMVAAKVFPCVVQVVHSHLGSIKGQYKINDEFLTLNHAKIFQ